MTASTAANSLELNEIPTLNRVEKGEALSPPSTTAPPRSWCGRAVRQIPTCGLITSACLGAGTAIWGGVITNYFFVGAGSFVAVASIVGSIAYLCNLPAMDTQEAVEDMQKQNTALVNEVKDLNTLINTNKQTILELQTNITKANENVAELKKTLSDNQSSLNDVTAKLTLTVKSLSQLQDISTQFRNGINELAKRILTLNNSNEKWNKDLATLASEVDKIQKIGIQIDSQSNEIKGENQILSSELQSYTTLLSELKTVVDAFIPDYQTQKAAAAQLEPLQAENKLMKDEIDKLQKVEAELEKTKETLIEFQKLSKNLADPDILSKLGGLMNANNDPQSMAQFLKDNISTQDQIQSLTKTLALPNTPEKLIKLVALFKK